MTSHILLNGKERGLCFVVKFLIKLIECLWRIVKDMHLQSLYEISRNLFVCIYTFNMGHFFIIIAHTA